MTEKDIEQIKRFRELVRRLSPARRASTIKFMIMLKEKGGMEETA